MLSDSARHPRILDLVKQRVVLFDGALGTMLMERGLSSGEPPEKWNLERPDVVKEIHGTYFSAGSDVVQTNTFGGNRFKLRDKRLDADLVRINQTAVTLAREVCPPGKFVAGDVGPSGKLMEPLGPHSVTELEAGFAEQAKVLVDAGVDLLSIETMFSLEETLAALRGVRGVTDLPIFVGMTFDLKPKGFFTLMGETPQTCVKALEENGADVLGSNCQFGSREMVDLIKEIRKWTTIPIIAQPNAGSPIVKGGVTIYEQSPEEFAEDILRIVEAGANVVGGCCGTTPRFIQESRHRLLTRA
ncbi:MAG: homocysteine S-methyltransferase family protein [Deltaproteobacteria bacterium]|nr:homocysteine S-methyltransferase family protein [Deltaproteobacteria bacterium]